MEIKLPEGVKYILDKLNENNYSSYIVGGCVRDSIMGITPHDWDITTDAEPDIVEKIFARTYPTGKKYGTITVAYVNEQIGDEELYEVTTFRSDGNYGDGRRPDAVIFGKSILDDLARRDFTINAIAYNELVGIVDPYDGQDDINNKLIRCVGDAKSRLDEDALRILRGIRFACKYNFIIQRETYVAMSYTWSNVLSNVSRERINNELLKIFNYAQNNDYTIDSFNIFWAELFENPSSTIKCNTLDLSQFICNNNSVNQKLFEILSTWDIVDVEIWLRNYKFSNKDIVQILNLYKISKIVNDKYTDLASFHINKNMFIRKLLSKFPYSDIVLFSELTFLFDKEDIDRNKQLPHSLSDLAVSGIDMLDIGLTGELIGATLNHLLDQVIYDPSINRKDNLLAIARHYKRGLDGR